MTEASKSLVSFIQKSPSPFHVVQNIANELEEKGFQYIEEGNVWELEHGKGYFTVRNDSSIIAFYIGKELKDLSFRMSASHTDSPTYKIKQNALLESKKGHWVLNVEGYGGMIAQSWLDTPLTIAGRVMIRKDNCIQSQNVYIDKDCFIIPRVAIHLHKEQDKLNPAIDMRPVFSIQENKPDFDAWLATQIQCNKDNIVGKDLYLVNRQTPSILGINQEWVASAKLDDLQGVYCCLQGFKSSHNEQTVSVLACFDNEEVGSNTQQGAMSTFLHDSLLRVSESLGYSYSQYKQALAHSMMVSVDNAHALHPNHPEYSDAENYPIINQGIVIKENASQKYTTDSYSRAIFTEICKENNIPVQLYANRSDLPGGSTLGNLSNMQVSVPAIDIGLAQWAMHSSYECAGNKDTQYMMDAIRSYYDSHFYRKANTIEFQSK